MKTCKNCGLFIKWEGMMIKVKDGYICHPDCGGGSKVSATKPKPKPSLSTSL